ncbi:lytic transglycosylase domain-containing protein [Thermovirga lienii]|uniref:lytic transglycosylase domain-containing protein n=1 Tax=Thermovirga lienii TaxID=336261 RepID=UPI002FE234E5
MVKKGGSPIKYVLQYIAMVTAFGVVLGGSFIYLAEIKQHRAEQLLQAQEAIAQEGKEEKTAVSEDNRTGQLDFYFTALNSVDESDLVPQEELLSYLGFDLLVRKYSQTTPIVAKAIPQDISFNEIRERAKMFEYIKASNSKIDDRTALIEVASVFWYGSKYKLPYSLIVGVMRTESNFNPKAVSKVNARGLMQVMWKYHSGLLQANGIMTEEDLHDPEKGIAAGCLVLSRYIRAEKSVVGGLKRYYGALSYHYVSEVLANWHSYELFALGVADEDWKKTEKSYWAKMVAKQPKQDDSITVKNTSSNQMSVQAVETTKTTSGTTTARPAQSMRVFDLKGYIGVYGQDGKLKKEWKKE